MTEQRTNGAVDFAALYDDHAEYTARRVSGSYEQSRVLLEATHFKIPNLVGLLAPHETVSSVLEIGCATGELIANFPVSAGGLRVGCDISPENIAAGSERFPHVRFHAGDFAELSGERFDAVILSDVLEHVDDDVGFLRRAALLGRWVLLNLPLEDNYLNKNRKYGPEDASGHLRKYNLAQGLEMIRRAGLTVQRYQEIWAHESAMETERRALRASFFGRAYDGSALHRTIKPVVFSAARNFPIFGRWLLASNLFALIPGGAA